MALGKGNAWNNPKTARPQTDNTRDPTVCADFRTINAPSLTSLTATRPKNSCFTYGKSLPSTASVEAQRTAWPPHTHTHTHNRFLFSKPVSFLETTCQHEKQSLAHNPSGCEAAKGAG
jgi:hypothetical protein